MSTFGWFRRSFAKIFLRNETRETGSEHLRRFAQNDHVMPDSFFATKTRKRKSTSSKDLGPSSSKKVLKTSNSNGRVSAKAKGNARAVDEESHSGGSGSEALDDMNLRTDEGDPNEGGGEDAGETPAEKRLRLVKLYLESVKDGLFASLSPASYSPGVYHSTLSADGEVNAAETDKELREGDHPSRS